MTVSGDESDSEKARPAVLISCRNEVATVATVVNAFKKAEKPLLVFGVFGLLLLAFLSIARGAILDTVTLGRREIKRLEYLGIPRFRGHRNLRAADAPAQKPVSGMAPECG